MTNQKQTKETVAPKVAPKVAPQPQVAPVAPQVAPQVDATQPVETDAYVPTYKVKPELKEAVVKAIGKHPFNQIAGLMNAINVEVMDHNSLTQFINVLGQFPYIEVAGILTNVNSFVEQIISDD